MTSSDTIESSSGYSRRDLLGTALTVGGLSVGLAATDARANMPAATRKRGYVQGPFGLLHYYDTGPKGRPLVLFHQAPMSARQFDSVYAPLAARGIRAIGVDTPGFGMSDTTSFVPKVEDWARILQPLLDALGIRQADVLGHHTGALLATEVALQFPERVRNVIVNGPFPITAEERQLRLEGLQKSEIDFEYKADGSHLAESFLRRYTMYGPGADPKITTRVIVEKFQGFGPFWYGHNAAYRYDHGAAMQRLKQRTLILTNTGDMIYEMAQRTRKLRPDFEYAELQGGGVDIVDQQPEAWADLVAKFLATAKSA